jgi:hypothetical protein
MWEETVLPVLGICMEGQSKNTEIFGQNNNFRLKIFNFEPLE